MIHGFSFSLSSGPFDFCFELCIAIFDNDLHAILISALPNTIPIIEFKLTASNHYLALTNH